MIKRPIFALIGLFFGAMSAIGGLYAWTYLVGNPQGSLFDNSLDAYNVFERFLIGLSLGGAIIGWWLGSKTK